MGALVAFVALLTFVPFDTGLNNAWHAAGLFRLALLMTSIVLCWTLAILVHETGHLIASRLMGYRFILFSAGPVLITSSGQRIRVSVNNKWALAGLMGAVPVDDHHLVRRESPLSPDWTVGKFGARVRCDLRGPNDRNPAARSTIGAILPTRLAWTTGLLSTSIGSLSFPPYFSSRHTSDGERFFMLLHGGSARRALDCFTADNRSASQWLSRP